MKRFLYLPKACLSFLLVAVITTSSPLSAALEKPWPVVLRIAMQRVANVEWRLLKAAGDTCPTTAAAYGIVFDSLDAYAESDRAMVARILNASDLPQVAAVAKGSTADLAGIMAGDDLVAINGVAVDVALQGRSPAGDTLALRVGSALASLPASKPIRMTIRREKALIDISLTPTPLCGSRIYVTTENWLNAYTDGANIAIPARMVNFTLSDDELAILAGHEIGHIIARDDKISGASKKRRVEDRADIVGADLAACAGFDTKSAAPFWRRLERNRSWHFLVGKTQSSGNARTQNVLDRPFPAQCPISEVPPLRK